LIGISRLFELIGVRRPVRYDKPVFAGDYDEAVHAETPDTFMAQYMDIPVEPHLGGQPNVTAAPNPLEEVNPSDKQD
jgi:hypothetical protein